MVGVYDDYNIEEKDDERTTFQFPYEEAVTDYGEPKNSEESKPEELDDSSFEYWKDALIVINDWGKYLQAKKLYINATHDETFFKVEHVIRNSFDGSVKKIKFREMELSKNVDCALTMFDTVCNQYGVEPVNKNWLFNNLKDGDDLQKIRAKAERRQAANKPAESLKNLVKKSPS